MRPSKVGSRAAEEDQWNDPIQIGKKPRWVLRSPYSILTATVRRLHEAGPQSTDSIARFLTQESSLASRPNARRTSGHSSAVQVLVTMGHLRLGEREPGGSGRLTQLGHRFADSLGTPQEAAVFRGIVLATPCFAWFWGKTAPMYRNLRRRDVLKMAEGLYPEYNAETRKTLVGVCLNYARAADLIQEIPGGRSYAVSGHRIPDVELGSLGAKTEEFSQAQSSTTPVHSGSESRSYDPLREAGILLGRALAEGSDVRGEILRARLRRAFDHALHRREQLRESTLVRVAAQLAEKALDADDQELIRLATLLVNGILDLEPVAYP